ncbi:uncharacterized protein LOC133415091 isoform X3 [Phycodurus eques]|uniref:uncharacterized protein LOC133415091 isoform X3 n=1 Tax=Phycodurus eques TaxID=693459 RepID=UPI002ACDE3B2|nr:uncharacterized protein LOC133415091 isoform X3 [Phycodurus eques]
MKSSIIQRAAPGNTFSQLKAGPVPSPRYRINNKFESMDTVKNNYPADYTNQCPVRSPPEPPKDFYVDAIHRKIAVNNPTSITEEPIKLPALYHRELPPPPPPRPPLANVNIRQTSSQRKFETPPNNLWSASRLFSNVTNGALVHRARGASLLGNSTIRKRYHISGTREIKTTERNKQPNRLQWKLQTSLNKCSNGPIW